jgi:hypothetical protein
MNAGYMEIDDAGKERTHLQVIRCERKDAGAGSPPLMSQPSRSTAASNSAKVAIAS